MYDHSSDTRRIEHIVETLFEAETRRLQAALDRLVEQHQEETKSSLMGFMFNGDYYWHSRNRVLSRLPMMAWSLNDAMLDFLKDEKTIMLDKQQIKQMLFNLVSLANSKQEVRDLLPECIISLVPELSKIPRDREVETLIEHHPRLLRQYSKALPKMKVYVVSRLMY